MLWAALLLDASPSAPSPRTDAAGLATWCLQFTPRVALAEASAVVMELEASVRLFGGKRRLAERVRDESRELGVSALSWAPNSLAALALARNGIRHGYGHPLPDILNALPMSSLSAVAQHADTLARLGCRTLGDVRALPRGGLSRRFESALLLQLDQAYGLRPEVHEWVTLPDHFCARLELMSRVELAPALLFGARRLLLQLCGWLAARHSGVTAYTLHWAHDAMRSRDAGEGGQLTIRTAEPTRQIEHLSRLLAERLAKTELLAPVGELSLAADEVHALEERSASLLPDDQAGREPLPLVLERIAARLGPDRVLRPVVHEDHRMEWMVHWQPAPLPRKPARCSDMPQPTFILPEPLKLAMRDNRPLYQGPLHLLSGPHRVEGGWWHRVATGTDGADIQAQTVIRDYWVAVSEHAGVLWVFQTRLADDQTAWFLHGSFA